MLEKLPWVNNKLFEIFLAHEYSWNWFLCLNFIWVSFYNNFSGQAFGMKNKAILKRFLGSLKLKLFIKFVNFVT